MNSIVLDHELLWKSIYAARDAEKYWRARRRNAEQDTVYTKVELEEKYQQARNTTRSLERLAPATTW